jgi:HSP20 family protein
VCRARPKPDTHDGFAPDQSREAAARAALHLKAARPAALSFDPTIQEKCMNDLRLRDMFAMDPFEDAFRNFARPWKSELMTGVPEIRVDVSETESNYTLKAEVPGARKEDINVRIDGNQVSITSEVKKESEEKKDGRVLRSERHYGFSSRTVWLDSPVDDAKAVAKYQNGVLELTLPKKTATSAKRLTIS